MNVDENEYIKTDTSSSFKDGAFDDDTSIQSFVQDLHSTISNEETFLLLQDFLLIRKYSIQNYQEILTKYILGTTYIVKS